MKNILTITLLVTGLAGNVFVYGQVKSDALRQTLQVPKLSQGLVMPGLVIMAPDHMPCLVTKSNGDRMYIKKLNIQIEPMPNPLQMSHLYKVEVMQGEPHRKLKP